MAVELSVIIATCDRRNSLEQTLHAIDAVDAPDCEWEVLVVDNGSTDDTASLLRSAWPRFHLVGFRHEDRGKAKALNTALRMARGELLVFTDDDVVPDFKWLVEMRRAARVYSSAVLFCGPIRPLFPQGRVPYPFDHPYCAPALSIFKPQGYEGGLRPGYLPYGPNFAVRRSAVRNLRYREDLGPSERNGPLMADDVAFVGEIKDRFSPFLPHAGFIYLPSAGVQHVIRPSQLNEQWLRQRFFILGRSRAARFRHITAIASPSRLVREPTIAFDLTFEQNAELHFYLGQLRQFQLMGDMDRVTFLSELLADFHLPLSRTLELCAEGTALLSDFHLYERGSGA